MHKMLEMFGCVRKQQYLLHRQNKTIGINNS